MASVGFSACTELVPARHRAAKAPRHSLFRPKASDLTAAISDAALLPGSYCCCCCCCFCLKPDTAEERQGIDSSFCRKGAGVGSPQQRSS